MTMCLRSLRLIRRPGLSPVVNRNEKERWWTTLTRIIQAIHEQGLYKIITGAGELNKDCHKRLNKKEGGKLLPF